jgi:hypothetical protein
MRIPASLVFHLRFNMPHADKIQTAREAFASHVAREAKRLEFMEAIFATLPDTVEAPVLSNESATAFFGQPGAWLSFRIPYGSKQTAPDILGELEAAGFVPLPCSLVQWDNYRRAVEPLAVDALPETKGRYKLSDAEATAPMWLEFNHHTGPSVEAFYRGPSGHVLRVSVDVKALPARVAGHGRHYNERTGNWTGRYTSATLQHPAHWHAVEKDGSPVANLSQHTRARIDSYSEEQTLSASAYWTPIVEGFDMSPAAMLRAICEA